MAKSASFRINQIKSPTKRNETTDNSATLRQHFLEKKKKKQQHQLFFKGKKLKKNCYHELEIIYSLKLQKKLCNEYFIIVRSHQNNFFVGC